jgi:hypothetical protein
MAATTTNKAVSGDARQQLNETKVREMVEKWYQLLDVHAPEADLLPLLSDGLEMRTSCRHRPSSSTGRRCAPSQSGKAASPRLTSGRYRR